MVLCESASSKRWLTITKDNERDKREKTEELKKLKLKIYLLQTKLNQQIELFWVIKNFC
jgi:hypothetical protein